MVTPRSGKYVTISARQSMITQTTRIMQMYARKSEAGPVVARIDPDPMNKPVPIAPPVQLVLVVSWPTVK